MDACPVCGERASERQQREVWFIQQPPPLLLRVWRRRSRSTTTCRTSDVALYQQSRDGAFDTGGSRRRVFATACPRVGVFATACSPPFPTKRWPSPLSDASRQQSERPLQKQPQAIWEPLNVFTKPLNARASHSRNPQLTKRHHPKYVFYSRIDFKCTLSD